MRVLLCQELLSIKDLQSVKEGQVTAVIEESMLNDTHLWKGTWLNTLLHSLRGREGAQTLGYFSYF